MVLDPVPDSTSDLDPTIRVIVSHPLELIRLGFQTAYKQHPQIRVVGECGSLAAAMDLLASTNADVLIAGAEPSPRFTDALRAITAAHPKIRCLLVISQSMASDCQKFLDAGAAACVSKSLPVSELTNAIKLVVAGRTLIMHDKQPRMFHAAHNLPTEIAHRVHGEVALSHREVQVMKMVAAGMTNKQAAEAMNLSIKTIETYRARMCKKLGLRDRASIVAYLRR